MKKFLFPLTLLLMIALLTGCSTMRTIDAAEDHLENQIEEKIEQSFSTVPMGSAEGQITREQAAEIALRHAGYSTEQVQFLRTEYDIDDHTPEYSVDFYADGLEYEYEIHAESGTVLSYDTDR